MIKINVSEEKIKEIEDRHWAWFEKEIYKEIIYPYFNISSCSEFEGENISEFYLEKIKKLIIGRKINKYKLFIKNTTSVFDVDISKIAFVKEIVSIIGNQNKLSKTNIGTIKTELEKELLKQKIPLVKIIRAILINENDLKKALKEISNISKELDKKIEKVKKLNGENITKEIFNYDKLPNKHRHYLMTELGVQVCPYCNRQYITAYVDSENNKNQATADLDHFYIKEKYPYLALSLYNFIPSCQICNSRMKGSKDRNVIYPYTENFGKDAKFTINLKNDSSKLDKVNEKIKEYDSDVLLGMSDNFIIDFNIDEKSENKEKIENSITTFKLKKVYQSHKDYVREIIKKAIIYNESYVNELYKQYEGTLFNNKEEVLQMIVSNYINEDELDKRVLAKLTKDICEELGLKR